LIAFFEPIQDFDRLRGGTSQLHVHSGRFLAIV
jgi:hypothetical protein